MGYYYGGPYWGWGIIGGIFWTVIMVLVIGLILRLTRGPRRHWRDDRFPPHRSSALELLKERYVKGEITKEQFDTMKKDIGEV